MLNSSRALAIGGDDLVLRTTNGGKSWVEVGVEPGLGAEAIDFFDDRRGIIVGTQRVAITDDGGLSWTTHSFPHYSPTDIVYVTASTLVATTFANERITYSTDGGLTWDDNLDVMTSMQAVAFADANVGVAVGSLIARTTDGGANWQDTGTDNYSLQGVAYAGQNTFVAVGPMGRVLRSTDAGVNWELIETGYPVVIFDVDFGTTGTGYAVGADGLVLRSDDRGSTWDDQASNNDRSLSGVSVSRVNDDIAIFVGSNGVIMRTVTGGLR
jgi:photosystem II stability/assembly factor-like uncharacterized protein